MSIHDQMARAKREILSWKKHFPHLLPQWHRLKQAEQDVKEANERLARAQAEWDRLGES